MEELLPVACSLTGPELAARRAGVLADIRRSHQEVRWLPDGVALRFTLGLLTYLSDFRGRDVARVKQIVDVCEPEPE